MLARSIQPIWNFSCREMENFITSAVVRCNKRRVSRRGLGKRVGINVNWVFGSKATHLFLEHRSSENLESYLIDEVAAYVRSASKGWVYFGSAIHFDLFDCDVAIETA